MAAAIRRGYRRMVLEEGIEPTRPCGHRILSPARLPVPPLELQRLWQVNMPLRLRSSRVHAGVVGRFPVIRLIRQVELNR